MFKNILNLLIVIISKTIFWLIKILGLGAGSTWPGEIALKINKNFIQEIFRNSQCKIILIAGTNGKTTTSTLIKYILEKEKYSVFQNEEGANLLNGVASAIIKNISINGRLTYHFGVFEIDENTLSLIVNYLKPDVLILLNLFRDQLDRYGEVNSIALKWKDSLKDFSTSLILNGDDPQIASISNKNAYYFGLSESLMLKREMPHDVDSIYCPKCKEILSYQKISYSHLGKYLCNKCGFTNPRIINYNLKSILKGVYNRYNINAAVTLLDQILHIPLDRIAHYLENFQAAFGRQEKIIYKNKVIHLLLSKNPTGFNQSIEAMEEILNKKQGSLLLVLNDRVPDGLDISWIWDVEFENLKNYKIVISGDRLFDMGLRMKYAEAKNFIIEQNLSKAIVKLIKRTKEKEIVILATYTGMLEVRKILVGKKLL